MVHVLSSRGHVGNDKNLLDWKQIKTKSSRLSLIYLERRATKISRTREQLPN